MIRSVQLLGAALALALAVTAVDAQTTPMPTIHARAKHRVPKPKPEGRQITVHKATPSYLTLGPGANLGPTNNYVTDTFAQPTPISGTFAGMRGRERIEDRFGNSNPGLTLFRF